MRTRSIKTKALAFLTAALLTFGVAAPSMIPVSAAETATQQQDTRVLENYLKGILPKDKSILLVDNGTGISMTTESEVTANGNGLLVIRRSKETAEDQSANIAGEKKDMFVCFNQVYYTATVDAVFVVDHICVFFTILIPGNGYVYDTVL